MTRQKVELEPKADALQSETPILDWVQLEYVVPVTDRLRARLGDPSLAHLGDPSWTVALGKPVLTPFLGPPEL